MKGRSQPSLRTEALRLSRSFILRPSEAIRRLHDSEDFALPPSALIFAVYLGAAILFYSWKPSNFPPPSPDAGYNALAASEGIFFWTIAQLWTIFFTAIMVGCLGWFAQAVKGDRGALRILYACLAGAILVLLNVVYVSTPMSKTQFAVACLGIAALAVPGLRRVSREAWLRTASLAMAVTVINLVLLPLFIAAVLSRSSHAYNAVVYSGALWTLGMASYGMSRLFEIHISRAIVVVIWSGFAQALIMTALRFLDLIPKHALKAMLTI